MAVGLVLGALIGLITIGQVANRAVRRVKELETAQNGPERSKMVGNAPERSETVENDEYGPCGGLYGVAAVWFAAGMMIAALIVAVFR